MADIKFQFSDLISTQTSAPVKLIVLEGQLDESNVDEFAPKVYELIETNPENTNYILDLEKLTYLNSKSIGYISDWYGKIAAKKGKLVIAKALTNIKDIFNVVGLDKVIPLTQTLDEAKNII
jgi:anti-anti-sigma factor